MMIPLRRKIYIFTFSLAAHRSTGGGFTLLLLKGNEEREKKKCFSRFFAFCFSCTRAERDRNGAKKGRKKSVVLLGCRVRYDYAISSA